MSFDFQSLVRIKSELKKTFNKQKYALDLFHLPSNELKLNKIRRFVISINNEKKTLNSSTNKISITSSVTCIKSLIFSNQHISYDFVPFIDLLYERFADSELTTTGLQHGNPFTVGLLLPVLSQLNYNSSCTNYFKYSKIIDFCIDSAKNHLSNGGINFDHFPKNSYLTYYNLIGLYYLGTKVNNECSPALQWSRDELYKQVCYFEAKDEEEADVFQLGYNLLIQYKFCRSTLRESIIDLCLKIIFESQLERGVWEKKSPLFSYANRGDAFPFSFELLNALLNEFSEDFNRLIPYEQALNKAFEWTKKNAKYLVHEQIEIPLWKSVTREEEVFAESWATAEVYLFLYYYNKYISHRIKKIVLLEFDGREYNKPDADAFTSLLYPEVFFPQNQTRVPLDKLLIRRLLDPLKLNNGKFSLACDERKESKNISGIFFGPPGTGKTTYVKCIAKYLGWPLVVINPSDFAKDGITLMPRSASEIFNKLIELEDTVVFFDEMEALITSRENSNTEFEQKFLTTTLLPKLQTLHDRANCIFIVATNYLQDIDEAAKRDGRFDFRIQILPPSLQAKYNYLSERLVDPDFINIIKNLIDSDENIKTCITYITRLEFDLLVREIIAKKCDINEIKNILTNLQDSYSLNKIIQELNKAENENIFPGAPTE